MRLIQLDEKRNLALKAIVYGCNTNKRLVGSSYMTGIDSGSPEIISFYDALDVIDKMMDDTIEAEPVKHGRWEWWSADNYKCSNCANITSVDEWMEQPTYLYCPNCGAKMDGGAENAAT